MSERLRFQRALEVWWNKPLVALDGEHIPAEIAVLRQSCRAGEAGAWLNSRGTTTGVEEVERGGDGRLHTRRVALPDFVRGVLVSLYGATGLGRGAPDLVIWNAEGRTVRFLEVKCPHWDRPSAEQHVFLAAARAAGFDADVVEWEFTGAAESPATTMQPRRERPFDSSKTRVTPVFDQLQRFSANEPQWARRLLDLAAPADRIDRPWAAEDLSVRDGDGYWGSREQGLQPPVALLSWLIRNFAPPGGSVPGSDFVATKRRKLLGSDSDTIEEGLALLRTKGAGKGWHVLEGPTYPDALLVTPDALVVVEGKRTEVGPTVDTTWMVGRHQMLRHLDAAWEIRGGRSVYGIMVVEGSPEDESTRVPEVWADAARRTTSVEALRSSLPHRGPEERDAIARSFVGVTTWQAICRAFRLDSAALPHRVAAQIQER